MPCEPLDYNFFCSKSPKLIKGESISFGIKDRNFKNYSCENLSLENDQSNHTQGDFLTIRRNNTQHKSLMDMSRSAPGFIPASSRENF